MPNHTESARAYFSHWITWPRLSICGRVSNSTVNDCVVYTAMSTSRDRGDASRCFRFNTAVVCRVASSFGEKSSFDDSSTSEAGDAGARPHLAECRQVSGVSAVILQLQFQFYVYF